MGKRADAYLVRGGRSLYKIVAERRSLSARCNFATATADLDGLGAHSLPQVHDRTARISFYNGANCIRKHENGRWKTETVDENAGGMALPGHV